MAKKQIITIQDQATGEILEFHTLKKACEYVNEVTGGHTSPSQLYNAMKRCGTVSNKRFKFLCDCDAEPDSTYMEDGWEFSQYEVSNTVIVAEKRFKWYDEDRIERITDQLKDERCKVFWDLVGDYYGAMKNRTRVEVYKKFEQGIPFKNKVAVLQSIIKNCDF